jgi:hypothetical protein
MRLAIAFTAFYLGFLAMGDLGSLSQSLYTPLGGALFATITVGLATIVLLLIADVAAVGNSTFRQLVLFTSYFAVMLAVSALFCWLLHVLGYALSVPHVSAQYVLAILAAWAAYAATLWLHPSR